jgi:hypothetical protein
MLFDYAVSVTVVVVLKMRNMMIGLRCIIPVVFYLQLNGGGGVLLSQNTTSLCCFLYFN